MKLVDVELVVKLLIVGGECCLWLAAVGGLLRSSLSLIASFVGICAVVSESTFACINSNSP